MLQDLDGDLGLQVFVESQNELQRPASGDFRAYLVSASRNFGSGTY